MKDLRLHPLYSVSDLDPRDRARLEMCSTDHPVVQPPQTTQTQPHVGLAGHIVVGLAAAAVTFGFLWFFVE